MSTTDVVIVSAVRTPVGSFKGALAGLKASELGAIAVKGALRAALVSPASVDDVVRGQQVLTATHGQTSPRRAAFAFRLPQPATAVPPLRARC